MLSCIRCEVNQPCEKPEIIQLVENDWVKTILYFNIGDDEFHHKVNLYYADNKLIIRDLEGEPWDYHSFWDYHNYTEFENIIYRWIHTAKRS